MFPSLVIIAIQPTRVPFKKSFSKNKKVEKRLDQSEQKATNSISGKYAMFNNIFKTTRGRRTKIKGIYANIFIYSPVLFPVT